MLATAVGHRCSPRATPSRRCFAFKGDVYTGLNADDFTEDDLLFAQKHLRMLSGLYGLLRPLDLMQPYRLEMGTKLTNPRGKDLYAFWGERISDWLNEALADQGDDVLLNLASNEYFSAVKRNALNARIINVDFQGHEERPVQDHLLLCEEGTRPDGSLDHQGAHQHPRSAVGIRLRRLPLQRERLLADHLVFLRDASDQ